MTNALAKLRSARREPEKVGAFLRESLHAAVDLLSSGRIGPLLGLASAGLLGRNLYLSYLERRSDGPYVTRTVHGNEMLLDPDDRGLSHDLATYGRREIASNAVFRRELGELAAEVDGDVTVLEVGANIGYYALQEASILGDRADIHAFEPSPKNVELLERNLERNGYADRFTVNQGAVGDEAGTVQLELASASNLHAVVDEATASPDRESVAVDAYTLDAYVADVGLDPSDVDVVRMDVEGYEIEVFEGMRSILEADGPLLMFLEFHPQLRGPEALAPVYDALEEHGFELRSATTAMHTGPYEVDMDVQSCDDLRPLEAGGRIVARR